jgi:hypothetical protein
MPPDLVDIWIAASETEAIEQGRVRHSAAFWEGAREWISERRRRPP